MENLGLLKALGRGREELLRVRERGGGLSFGSDSDPSKLTPVILGVPWPPVRKKVRPI